MTVSAVVPSVKFAGSSSPGTSGPFSLVKSGTPITFSLNSHIEVYRYDTTDDLAPVLLTENTDYTLTGGPTAGSITLTSPQTGLLTAERLLVRRKQPVTQPLNLGNGSDFSAAAFEARFDRIVEMIAEDREKIGRAVKATTFGVESIPDFNLAAALGKIAYLDGTEDAPVWAYHQFDAADLAAIIDALDDLGIIAADLRNADTIGQVAAIAGDVSTVAGIAADVTIAADNDANITTVADALNGSGLPDALPILATGSSTPRTLADRARDVFNVLDYGAVPDGATVAQTAIENCINAALAAGGGTVVIAGDSRGNTFLVDDSIYPDLLDAHLVIEFRGGAQIVADAGLGDPVLKLWASASDESIWTEFDLAILNPRIDCSAGDSPITGGQFCTGISLQYSRNVLIDNPWIYGGTLPTNVNADTGIDTVSCKKVLIRGGLIEGFNDAGVYPNGDNTAGAGDDDGLVCVLDNVMIRRCNTAIAPKRELRLLKVIGGVFEECASGIVGSDVSSPSYTGPPRRIDIIGTEFRKMTANMVRFTAGTKGSVRGCTFEDWGYNPVTGATSVTTNAYAIDLYGASDIEFSNNVYKNVNWALDQQRVYRFRNGTFNSVPFTHGNCRFVGETYDNIWRTFGIDDAGNPHFYSGVHFNSISDAKWPTTNMNAATIATYTYEGSSQLYAMRGGVEHPMGPQGVWFVLASSGAAIAHTGTTSATVLATVTIPGGLLRENGTIRVNSTWVAGANNANAKSCLVRLGGAAGTQYQNVNIASTINLSKEILITNRNNAASQVGSFVATSGNSLGTSTGAVPTSTVDTASATTIVFQCVLGDAGDTVTLERYSVEACSVA